MTDYIEWIFSKMFYEKTVSTFTEFFLKNMNYLD